MKILYVGLILVTLLSLGNIRTSANQQKENNDPSTKEGLKISLISSKGKYRRSEKIKLHVMLNNITAKNIYLLGSLGWEYNANLLLHVRDAAGKEIDPDGFPDDQIFVDPLDEGTFVKLPPRQFIGTTLVSDLKFLNMNNPGKYSIYVEYFSKVPSSGVKQKPFWGNENGTIVSNLVWVEIIRDRPNDATVRCKQVKHSSKRRVPGPLLCGPLKKVSEATTALGPNTVELRVLIDENGKVTSVKPVLGNSALFDAAVNAVNKMRFTPKRISGVP